MPETNFGCRVQLTLCDPETGVETTLCYRNVTETHYDYYRGTPLEKLIQPSINFESHIHFTSAAWPIAWVLEFETQLETEIAPGF